MDISKHNIDPYDLRGVEDDLNIDELVSIVFLLYGNKNVEWILQKLLNLLNNPQKKMYLLQEYALHFNDWKLNLLEALTLTGCFQIIENLGILSSECREKFSAGGNNMVINSGLRLLYELCENSSQKVTKIFSTHVKEICQVAQKCDDEIMELYLMFCISNNLIKIGSTLDDCDFTFILDYFKHNKVTELEEVLDKFPIKSNSIDNAGQMSTFNGALKTIQISNSNIGKYKTEKLHVLIINQQTFYREENPEVQDLLPDHALSDRKGTEHDKKALKNLFGDLKYQVECAEDLSHIDILKAVDRATKKAARENGLIVCILSHGHEGIVYGSNSIPVRIKDIRGIMASKLLLSKPKILLIQACQGDNLQKSAKKIILTTELDGPSSSTISGSLFADFLTFWSTIEGFASVRHIDNGTWFIQELVQKIKELHVNQHFIDICTTVIHAVHSKRGYRDECMLPKIDTTFTKNFYLPHITDSKC
ncbi:unnamed protein product [Diamesa serratosioi]